MLIKICGITSPEAARQCFEAGADMIGLVHYKPSPRHLEVSAVRKIIEAAEMFRKTGQKIVLVVSDPVPEDFSQLLTLFSEPVCGKIDYIQWHGSSRPPETQQSRLPPLIHVVRDRERAAQWLRTAPQNLPAVAPDTLFLYEMSKGTLPGGNGNAWDWADAEPFCRRFPTMIAGGITPENAAEAVRKTRPFGIDVSSGVEDAPGIKNVTKIKRIIENIK
ncbi:MAG: phosphoribosylanthranilate isomerase [Planctomycetaceae bacterium]|jgi:phosphoribosylanthranilate isomerase|nr:phosphoribosylanthranilate isomerase [Planctomycetaceae bacterium]